jgi:protein XRP2
MVDQCKNCTLVIGPIKGSVFIRDCEDCIVHVACQQFRCRDFKNSSIFLYAANDPIIEASSGLRFGPFNLGYPKLAE